MFKLDQHTTKTLVAIHGWTGVLLGLLLYIIVLTGTVAVFSEEIGEWSIGAAHHDTALGVALPNPEENQVQRIIDTLARQVDPAYLEEVGIGMTPRGHLDLFYHMHRTNDAGQLEDFGIAFKVDKQTGEVLSSQEGTGAEIFRGNQDRKLARFFVDIHTELHLPRPWGLIATGILGLAMMALAVSGFVMHRHLFKDIFTWRRERGQLLKAKDAHTVAGTWALPFAFVLAFTGSFFSFAGSIGIPMMAIVGFGGNQDAMFEAVLGTETPENPAPASSASIDKMVADAYARTGVVPRFAVLEHYGRADANITFFVPAKTGELADTTLIYNGMTGAFVREKPRVGQQPSTGSTLFDLMTPLHFGHFMGVTSKAIWFSLGLAMCYVTLTGMLLWVEKRREERIWHLLEKWVVVVGYGLPIAMIGAAYGFLLSYHQGSANFWTPVSFLLISALVLVYGAINSGKIAQRILCLFMGITCLLLPVARIALGGPLWSADYAMVVSVDLLLLLLGMASVANALRDSNQMPSHNANPLIPATSGAGDS